MIVTSVNIKALRLAAGLSQIELSRRAGIREQTYIDIEKGRTMPRLDTLTAISKVLGYDVSFTKIP